MRFNSDKHHRRSIRLIGYDYASAGVYFITICTHNKECLFGDIVKGKMALNDVGTVAESCWREIQAHFPFVNLDEFVIMPNHVHGIIGIMELGVGANVNPIQNARTENNTGRHVGANDYSPLPSKQPCGTSKTIGSIVRGYKIGVTKWFHQYTNVNIVWQRNYYEHIIRDDDEMNHIRDYIANNPRNWETDDNRVRANDYSSQQERNT